MTAVIGDPRKAGEAGPAGDQRKAGEEGPAGDPRPAGEQAAKASSGGKRKATRDKPGADSKKSTTSADD